MLVLTRKIGERIVIAGNIEVTVVRIRGNRVRLGLTLPRQLSVERSEVRNRIANGSREPDSPAALRQNTEPLA